VRTERQRRGAIPAWANGPGQTAERRKQGLKARSIAPVSCVNCRKQSGAGVPANSLTANSPSPVDSWAGRPCHIRHDTTLDRAVGAWQMNDDPTPQADVPAGIEPGLRPSIRAFLMVWLLPSRRSERLSLRARDVEATQQGVPHSLPSSPPSCPRPRKGERLSARS
jgi:hypothetical protein